MRNAPEFPHRLLRMAEGARARQAAGVLWAAALIWLLASPVSWVHHWVWCVPVLVYLAVRGNAWPAFAAVFLVFVTRLHEFDTFIWLTVAVLAVLAVRPVLRSAVAGPPVPVPGRS